jgi:glycosyltransferase involved in cell wall biosynthesis
MHRNELANENGTIFLGYFGKLSPEKNVLKALHIFLGAKEKLNNQKLKFLIVGDGNSDYLSDIKAYIEDNELTDSVVFLPMQNRDGLRGYLSLCKAAFWIGSASNCIQEAMGCKTVPFLMKSTATEQLVIDDRQIIDLGQIDTAIDNVCSVINDEHINLAIENYASENFTWESSAKAHINIYQGIK